MSELELFLLSGAVDINLTTNTYCLCKFTNKVLYNNIGYYGVYFMLQRNDSKFNEAIWETPW